MESESDPLTRRVVDVFKKEPLKGNSEVHLHTPTKFGDDRSKDLGGDREQTDRQTNRQTDKRCSIYSMIFLLLLHLLLLLNQRNTTQADCKVIFKDLYYFHGITHYYRHIIIDNIIIKLKLKILWSTTQ